MGNKLPTPLLNTEDNSLKVDISHSRFMKADSSNLEQNLISKCLSIPEFNRMEDWQVQLQGLKPPEEAGPLILSSLVCFRSKEWMDAYLTSLLSLKQFVNSDIYNEIIFQSQPKEVYSLLIRQNLPQKYQQIRKSILSGIHINTFLDLLIFISKMTSKIANMYIPPEEIYLSGGEFYVRSFYYKQYDKNKLMLTYIAWLYEEFQAFNDLFQSQQMISLVDMDIYLREIYITLRADKICDSSLTLYLTRVKEKYNYLNYNFDSFQACCRSKKSKCYPLASSEWLLAKRGHQVYFFNIKDKHLCQGKVIRKKNKINVEQVHAIFNKEQLEVNFMLQGTKNMVKTSEFELEDNFTISDIEIKYKFPLKLRNPMTFRKGKQIFFFDQMVYRYVVDENKLYQESKRINDGIFLTSSNIHKYIVLRLSTDIFRHGIRIYYDDKYDTVYPSGNPTLAAEIEHIRIDIKHIDFCVQIYKGVYLLLATRNLWILDLNFSCFFSYSPLQRVKQYYKNKVLMEESEFCFEILEQSFAVNWLPHQDNLNVSIQGDKMHTIGLIMGKLFYLQYQFIFQAGLLKLKTCEPLFSFQPKVSEVIEITEAQKRQFTFSIYSEHFDTFKTSKWIYKGNHFLQVYFMKAVTNATYTSIILQTEQVLGNLKEIIEQSKKINKKWSKNQTAMVLYTISSIFTELSHQNIAHKHFNISNLWVTKKKQLKLTGWSEPHRNWYISDYKDYLLTCFNIITMNNSEKITQKLIEKHNSQLAQFQVLKEKMIYSLKHKLPQKKVDQQKYMITIRQSLHKNLAPIFKDYRSDNYIFSFEFNTPRFSMLTLKQNKIKKMTAIIEGGHNNDEFTFKNTDQYIWNQGEEKLYIFTVNYQMLEATFNLQDFKEETVVLEEYQYLPKNIVECSFISTPQGLFAFGGIARYSKKTILYNQDIYHFDQIKLTWVPVASLPSPRMQPKLTLSNSGTHIYLMGGELGLQPDHLSTLKFNILTHQIQNLIDYGCLNPFRFISVKQTHTMFHIAEQEDIFLLWTTNATNYSFKIFSTLVCSLEISFQGKIYLEDGGEMPEISIAFADGAIHFLRPYGKYTKISLGALQNISVSHKTLYSN